MAGFTRDGGDSPHESATNTKNMNVQPSLLLLPGSAAGLKLSLAAHNGAYSLASVFCYTYGFVRLSLSLCQAEQQAQMEGILDFFISGCDTLRAAMLT